MEKHKSNENFERVISLMKEVDKLCHTLWLNNINTCEFRKCIIGKCINKNKTRKAIDPTNTYVTVGIKEILCTYPETTNKANSDNCRFEICPYLKGWR